MEVGGGLRLLGARVRPPFVVASAASFRLSVDSFSAPTYRLRGCILSRTRYLSRNSKGVNLLYLYLVIPVLYLQGPVLNLQGPVL